jgi:endonuclease/exonuclease/phosphatase family metal-dependent hydrolase
VTASDAPAHLRVMTWNLWWRFGPWEEREAAIIAVIAAEQPDVVLLQEVWSHGPDSSAARIADALGYHAVLSDDAFPSAAVEPERIGFHNAILSRWPLADECSIALVNSQGAPGHRRLVAAQMHSPWGAWPVLSTHLDYRFDESALRQAQAAELLAFVAEYRGDPDTALPMIVGGDFNAVPDSDEIRLLTGRRAGAPRNLVLSDAWEQVGEGAGLTWRDDNPYQTITAWPRRRLDYVFVSWPRPKPVGNPVAAHLAGVDDRYGIVPSDHAAVVVELVTPDSAGSRG